MAIDHSPWSLEEGLSWVDCLGDDAEDQYRRCISKDQLEVGKGIGGRFPTSSWSITGYVGE